MATFKAEVQKHQKRKDKTWNVKIRITHNRVVRRLPTSIYVNQEDLTVKNFKIKNQEKIDQCNEIINYYRNKCSKIALTIDNMSIDELVDYLNQKEEDKKKDIDFVSFAKDYINNLEKQGKNGTASNYKGMLQSLINFMKRDIISISEITYSMLVNYSKFLIEKKEKSNLEAIKKGKRITTNRMLSNYTACIRHLHKEAKLKYNDEEKGVILIPWSPFMKFKVPKEETTRKRALSPQTIKAIYDLPYIMRHNARKNVEQNCRYNLAKDVFILSFCLIGMNSADLYSCDKISNNTIQYFREKTRTRRRDNAEIHVDVPPFISDLLEKYKDHTGKRVFRFYQMYADYKNFNKAINKGLKEIEKIINDINKSKKNGDIIEDLEFYAARHSWATIAANDLKIDKYIVHSALNHVDESMRVTEIYIKKDFSSINEANSKVVDYVFNKKGGQ